MRSFYLKASEVYCEDGIQADTCIKVTDGKITGIGELPDTNDPVIDMTGARVIPGLIDLHIHGSAGADVMDATYDALNTISKHIAANGVTGFLGTTVTSTWEATLVALRNVRSSMDKGVEGAQLLGSYSEGLFFSERFKGAHAAEYFLKPTCERVDAMIAAGGGTLKSLAIAPEIEGALEVIRHLAGQGINVMIGHTGATYQQSVAAFEAGAVGGVHIFNQMLGLHHRQPGTVGAVLHHKDILAELIADGIHVDPVMLSMVYRLKGADKTALITDCMCAGGLSDGHYQLGQLMVTVKEGIARTDSGALAGSTLALNRGVTNMIELAEVPPLEAVHMASLTPATLLGIEQEVGSIKMGKRANLAVLGKDNSVLKTFVDGREVFSRPDV